MGRSRCQWHEPLSAHTAGEGEEEKRTSPPVTLPVFATLNETSNAGRCSQIAVEPPSMLGDGSPSAHAASSAAEVWSAWCTVRTCRFEYEKVVYESPKPNSKRGSMLFCRE